MRTLRTLRNKPLTFLALLWIGVIFAFSMQGGDASSSQSGFVVTLVIQLFKILSLPTEGYNLPFYVRKVAHFTEYFILGILSAVAQKEKTGHPALYLLIPIIDESIQFFTPGRVMSPIDMAIDMSGYVCGYTVSRWVIRLLNQ